MRPMGRTAGFMWNTDPSSPVLGVYLPDAASVFAPPAEILERLHIDPHLVRP